MARHSRRARGSEFSCHAFAQRAEELIILFLWKTDCRASQCPDLGVLRETLRESLRLLKEKKEFKQLRLNELRKEIAIGGAEADRRLQHLAFEYRNLDDLLGTYARLKEQGIVPVLCTDSGSQTAFYYEDPDRNSIELNTDNYGDSWTSSEHLRNSQEFAKNPMGKYVDPDKMVAARRAGASPWELHERAWTEEFAPAKPYDPRVLL